MLTNILIFFNIDIVSIDLNRFADHEIPSPLRGRSQTNFPPPIHQDGHSVTISRRNEINVTKPRCLFSVQCVPMYRYHENDSCGTIIIIMCTTIVRFIRETYLIEPKQQRTSMDLRFLYLYYNILAVSPPGPVAAVRN